jgi:type VI secretion system protein ImpK
MANKNAAQLRDCFVDLIGYTVLLKKTCAVTQPAFEEVNSRIRQLVNESAQHVVTYGVDPRDYDDARFAICAWIDETIMNVPWAHREQWQRNLLQSELYGTTNAGSEFFERINQLSPDQTDVREIYFLCLGLGFMGRYSLEADQFLLEQLKKSSLRSLTGKVSEPLAYAHENMFASAYGGQVSGLTGLFPKVLQPSASGLRILLWSVPPLLLIILYVIYTFVLNGVMDNLMLHVMEG